MSAYPIIFPSLSRQPSMDSSKSVEDDTIRDQAESGYVGTRPRFTRARRTWKMNIRNLVYEDVRALDDFFMQTTQRGGNSFLFPNLLPNGSFELPAVDANDFVSGWTIARDDAAQNPITVAIASKSDGTNALSISTAFTDGYGFKGSYLAEIDCSQRVACTSGEGYVLTAQLNIALTNFSVTLPSVYFTVKFFDVTGGDLSTITGATASTSSGWQQYGLTFTAPENSASFQVQIVTGINSADPVGITEAGTMTVLWDDVACALQTPLTPYGRMAGSAPLGCLVRFSKIPEIADIGFGGGVKRYGANFELTEV